MPGPYTDRRSWKTHAMFFCQDCEWQDQDWQNATRNAQRHAAKTGHAVYGETGYCVRYNEKDGDK